MAFKMKGPSLYKGMGGFGAKGAIKNNKDYAGKADGRATSSPFQVKTDKTKEELLAEGFNQKDADMMIKDGATTGRPKEKKKPVPPKKTTVKVKKGSAADNKSKKVSQEDFVPAYPGADYSKEQIAKMTEKEKMMKIDGYEPKKKTTKKK